LRKKTKLNNKKKSSQLATLRTKKCKSAKMMKI